MVATAPTRGTAGARDGLAANASPADLGDVFHRINPRGPAAVEGDHVDSPPTTNSPATCLALSHPRPAPYLPR